MKNILFDDVKEMSTWHLAHNMFFVKKVDDEREAWHRDFEREISCRDLTREIFKTLRIEVCEEFMTDDETFDSIICDMVADGHESIQGIVALYYQTMWAFAENRAIAMSNEDEEFKNKIIEDAYPVLGSDNKRLRAEIEEYITLCTQYDKTIKELNEDNKQKADRIERLSRALEGEKNLKDAIRSLAALI